MNQKSAFRVGLIGYGFAGKTFHAPLIGAVPALRLTTVASSNAEKVRADLPDVDVVADPLAVIDSDIDLVVIASPNDTHAPLAEAALRRGKHVVVDKPFTLTLDDARSLKAVADAEGRVLSVFQNRRWDSDFLSVKRAIDEGRIGRVTHFESHVDRFRPAVRDRWREGDGAGSGLWFDLGPHMVDQALCLFGVPDTVLASMAHQRTGARSDDWAHVILAYGASRVILHASMLVAGAARRFVVHGTNGSLVKQAADRQEQQLLSGMSPGDTAWGSDPDDLVLIDDHGVEHRHPAVRGDQREYYRHLAAALDAPKRNPVTPTQAVTVMAVIEAARKSYEVQRTVALDLSDEERAAWPAPEMR